MNKFMFKNLERVSKATARRLFNNGEKLRVCMHKVDPTNEFYHLYSDVERDGTLFANLKDFDKFINFYTVHNANYQLGYYMAFYHIK